MRFGDALACRQDVEALVALGAEEVPARLEVPDEAVGLVLGRHGDVTDAGVERIREGKVDDARFCPEVHRRLDPLVGQLEQSAAAASGQNVGHGAACERGSGRDLGHRCETLVSLGKSAHSYLGCLSTTAIDEPRELARMDCPPGLLVGPQRPL